MTASILALLVFLFPLAYSPGPGNKKIGLKNNTD